MCLVLLKDLINGCAFPEAGNKLYAILCEHLASENQVVINMEGVSSLPSMFPNTSFGQYILQNGKAPLAKVSFQRISQQQAQRIKEYIARF